MKSFHFHEVIHNKITVVEFHIIYWRLISFNQYSCIAYILRTNFFHLYVYRPYIFLLFDMYIKAN